jgi:hypothetical protein
MSDTKQSKIVPTQREGDIEYTIETMKTGEYDKRTAGAPVRLTRATMGCGNDEKSDPTGLEILNSFAWERWGGWEAQLSIESACKDCGHGRAGDEEDDGSIQPGDEKTVLWKGLGTWYSAIGLPEGEDSAVSVGTVNHKEDTNTLKE